MRGLVCLLIVLCLSGCALPWLNSAGTSSAKAELPSGISLRKPTAIQASPHVDEGVGAAVKKNESSAEPRPGNFDWPNLEQFMGLAKDSSSINQFLLNLQSNDPDFFKGGDASGLYSNVQFLHHSLSSQDASWQAPRVVVFRNRARLSFAFNGAKEQNGFANLEIMTFNDSRKAFEFRTVIFKADAAPGATGGLSAEEIDSQNGNVIISKANPASCVSCHGADPKPKWDTFDVWPGVYFGQKQNLVAASTPLHWPSSQRLREFNEFSEYAKKIQPGSRYEVLKKNILVDKQPALNPELALIGDQLQDLNIHRVADRLVNDVRLQPYFPLLLAMQYCPDVVALNPIPKGLKVKPLSKTGLSSLQQSIRNRLKFYYRSKFTRLVSILGPENSAVGAYVNHLFDRDAFNWELFIARPDYVPADHEALPQLVILENIISGLDLLKGDGLSLGYITGKIEDEFYATATSTGNTVGPLLRELHDKILEKPTTPASWLTMVNDRSPALCSTLAAASREQLSHAP